MEDRRGAHRFPITLPLEVSAPSSGAHPMSSARTRDVSFRGVYFTANQPFQAGSPIRFILTLSKEITLSADVRVQCVGRVVRVEKSDSGEAGGSTVDGGRVGVAVVIEQYDFLPPTS